MNATTCICTRPAPPFDHLLELNPKCLAHRKDIQLVAAGWTRVGAELWRKPLPKNLGGPDGGQTYIVLTQEEAYDSLNETELPKGSSCDTCD